MSYVAAVGCIVMALPAVLIGAIACETGNKKKWYISELILFIIHQKEGHFSLFLQYWKIIPSLTSDYIFLEWI